MSDKLIIVERLMLNGKKAGHPENLKVGIVMGSDPDLPVMKEAARVLKYCGIEYEFDIISAHRTPDRIYEYAKNAENEGIGVIIAGAGGAAHLPGVIAALTNLPVIGVPVKSKSLKGIDSLLSIAQMPKGIPVATVDIDDALSAGIFAAKILSINNDEIREKLKNWKIGKDA